MSRLLRCTAVTLALAALLTGCSSSKSEPKAAPSASAAASNAAVSAGTQPSATSAEPAVAGAALLKAAGEKADAAGTVSYSMVIKSSVPGKGVVTTTAEGVSALKPPIRGRLTMTSIIVGKPVAMEMLMTPDAIYFKYPPDLAKAFGGKAWVKMAFADLEKAGGLSFRQLVEQAQQSSPTAYLNALVAAGDIKEVGKESIRGTETTHYSGTIDRDALTKAYGGELQSKVKGLLTQMGTSPVKMDVWIAADGLPRRLHQVTTVAGNDTDIAMEFLKFGAKLDVSPPPADETTDFGKMLGGQPPA